MQTASGVNMKGSKTMASQLMMTIVHRLRHMYSIFCRKTNAHTMTKTSTRSEHKAGNRIAAANFSVDQEWVDEWVGVVPPLSKAAKNTPEGQYDSTIPTAFSHDSNTHKTT